MRRIPRWTIGVAVLVLAIGAVVFAMLPEMVLPSGPDAARDALAAFRGAKTVTITAVDPADGKGSLLFRGTVRRSTSGPEKVRADFRHVAITDFYPDVEARVVDGTTYAKNYSNAGHTPWVALRTDGSDDLSVALAMIDPTRALEFAEENAKYTQAERSGAFGMSYSVFCGDCGAALMGDPEQGGTAATGTAASVPEIATTVEFVLDLRGRPTSVTVTAQWGGKESSMSLRMSDFGAPLTIDRPAGAKSSQAPVAY